MTPLTETPARAPTKNLLICFGIRSLDRKFEPAKTALGQSLHFLPGPEAELFLGARRALFPEADGQELAGLAIYPQALRIRLGAALSRMSEARFEALQDGMPFMSREVNFSVFTPTSALASVSGNWPHTNAREAQRGAKEALALFDAHITKAFPNALKIELDLIPEGEPQAIEGAMLALFESHQLRGSAGPKPRARASGPRSL